MDQYTVVIIATAVGFFALAAALLIPVYRFLKREEKAGEEFDRMYEAHRRREREKRTNGETDDDDGGEPVPA